MASRITPDWNTPRPFLARARVGNLARAFGARRSTAIGRVGALLTRVAGRVLLVRKAAEAGWSQCAGPDHLKVAPFDGDLAGHRAIGLAQMRVGPARLLFLRCRRKVADDPKALLVIRRLADASRRAAPVLRGRAA